MERSRHGYRGRYRDRHSSGSINRNQLDERSRRGNYHRGHPPHDDDDHNGNAYPPRNSPNGNYHYRSSRPSLNSRPVSSRNGPSTSYRHYSNDDYASSSSSSHRPTGSNSKNNNNSTQSAYYDNRSPSSRLDRSSNHRETYSSLINEQSMLSNSPPPSLPMYYSSSQGMPPSSRDRSLPLPPASYIDPERHRYVLPPSSSAYRRESPPPVMSTYRNERSMDYAPRNTNNDMYMRREYRPPTPPSLAPLTIRGDPYGDVYRSNDYAARSERYDIPSNRTEISSRDYPMASVSSSYRDDGYRKTSNVSMSSPPTSSSYISHEQYSNDMNYRSIAPARDYDVPSSRPAYSSSMEHRKDLSRNSRDHNPNAYRSSHHDRPNLKRSGSRYDDNAGPIPSKRPMRR